MNHYNAWYSVVNAIKISQRKFENSEGETLPSRLDWGILGHGRVRMKALAKVRLCKGMRISATRNNREDLPGNICLNVEVEMFTGKLTNFD